MTELRAGERVYEIDAVVFDKDGTLIDFHHLWSDKAQRTVSTLATRFPGFPELTDRLYRALGHDPKTATTMPDAPLAVAPMDRLEVLVAQVLQQTGIATDEARTAAHDVFRTIAGAIPTRSQIQPIGDLPKLFRTLEAASVRIALATSDDRLATEETLRLLGLTRWVEASVCGDDALPAKPAAEVLEHLAGRLGVPVDRMMMVGDTVCDLHAGRNAGAGCCVGVTSGTSDRDTLSPLADAVLGTVHELKIDC